MNYKFGKTLSSGLKGNRGVDHFVNPCCDLRNVSVSLLCI